MDIIPNSEEEERPLTFFEMCQSDRFLVDMFDPLPSNYITRKEAQRASSYINNKGEHPKKGTNIYFKDMIFKDVDLSTLKDGQWKFINSDKGVEDSLRLLQDWDCMPASILED